MPYKTYDQQRQFQATWMWRRRQEWILSNGPCQRCGARQDLCVVYKDPNDKVIRVPAIWSRREEERARLLALCVVLCKVCALDKRREERQPEHGSVGRYDQGCRCDPCKAAKSVKRKAEYQRAKERRAATTKVRQGAVDRAGSTAQRRPRAASRSPRLPAGELQS